MAFSFFRLKTLHQKVLFGYGMIIFLSLMMLLAGFVHLWDIKEKGSASLPVLAEKEAMDDLMAALTALDGHIEGYDPALESDAGADRIRRATKDLREAERKLEAAAVLPDTRSRIGLLRDAVGLALAESYAVPDAMFDEVAAKRAHALKNVRKARAVATALAATTGVDLAERVRKEQANVEFAWSMLLLVEGLLLLLGVFLAVKGSELIAKPIHNLKEMAITVAKGEYDTRASITGEDEIGALAEAMNAMADRMTHYNRELEREVAGRTKELNEKVDILNTLNRDLDQSATLLVRRDLELTRANERLRELDRMKSEFLSVAAHQLRTPLSAVKWVFNLVLEERMGALNDEQKNFLLKGKESNERMVRLVDDMLTVTRIEGGRTEYAFARQNIKDILDDLIPTFAKDASDRGLHFEARTEIAGSTFAMVDSEKIRFVFENLIDNAIRYTPAGGAISIVLNTTDKLVAVDVADTGIGIPEAEQSNIFGKFFRATNAIKVVTDGNGLGLFVVKTIVERHGGSVTFESVSGKGTRFTVLLPLLVEHAPTAAVPTDSLPGVPLAAPGRSV